MFTSTFIKPSWMFGAAIGCLLFAAVGIAQDSSLDSYERAQYLYDHGRPREAISYYQQALQEFPEDRLSIFSGMGDCYSDLGENDRARQSWRQATEISPSHAFGYSDRAWAYRQLGELDKAMQDWEQALRMNPSNHVASIVYNNRGLGYSDQEKYEVAIREFDESIRREPATMSYCNRGDAYRKLGKYQQAIDDYNRAVEMDSANTYPYICRGIAYRRLALSKDQGSSVLDVTASGSDYFERAQADFEQAIRISPDDSWAHDELAWLLATCPDARRRNGPKAFENANRACMLSNWNRPDCIETLAAAYAECGDFTHAIEYQQQALEMLRRDKASSNSIGWAKDTLQLYREKIPLRE